MFINIRWKNKLKIKKRNTNLKCSVSLEIWKDLVEFYSEIINYK